MPFRKVGKDRYKSPSGRTFTSGQVRAYYAKKGNKPSAGNPRTTRPTRKPAGARR